MGIVGQRTATKSVAAVMAAFIERKTWTQADLARHVGLERPAALRKVLEELQESGIPLVSEKGHPHVYWRMPKDWYPGGVLFKAEHVPTLLRQLSHLPGGKVRDRLLRIVIDQLPARGKLLTAAPVVSRRRTEQEEEHMPVVEESAARKLPLFMKYFTASRGGRQSDRHVSVHVVDIGPPARFIATCHKNGDLRWFRVEGIARARVDETQKFRECDPTELDAFRAASLDGFKGAGPAVACSFFVREPECVWIANNLLEGMHAESLHGGIRVSLETSAIIPLARFVVRFGDAIQPETPALAQAIAELARGALEQAEATLHRAENLSASDDLDDAPARPRSDV
jgi:predicted DNA-binding transcriptional regulator YafY